MYLFIGIALGVTLIPVSLAVFTLADRAKRWYWKALLYICSGLLLAIGFALIVLLVIALVFLALSHARYG